jgi:hypothetical protein
MRVERWSAIAGLALMAAVIGGVVTESIGPDVTKSAAAVTAKVASNRSDLLINSALHLAAGVAVLFFVAGLATLIVESGGSNAVARIVLASGIIAGAASVLTAVLAATVASSIHQLHDNQAAYLLYRGATTSATATTIFVAVTIAATAEGLTGIGLLSKIAGRIGLLVAAIFLLGGFDFLAPDAGPLSPFEKLGGVLAVLYIITVSATLLGAARTSDPARPHVSAGTAIG